MLIALNYLQRRRLLYLAFVLAFISTMLMLPTLAFAEEGPVGPVAVQGDSSLVTFTPFHWTIITGVIMPFVIGLITKASASPRFQAIVGIVLAAVAAVVERATIADGSAIISQGLLVDVLMVYAPQLLTYLGLWRNFALNQRLAPRFGLG